MEEVIGHVGDVDPCTHSGGFIVKDEDIFWLWYWEGVENLEDAAWDVEPEDFLFCVRRIEIPENVDEEYDWGVDAGFKQYIGEAEGDEDTSLQGRAQRLVDLANYHGWINLDPWETNILGKDLMERFDC